MPLLPPPSWFCMVGGKGRAEPESERLAPAAHSRVTCSMFPSLEFRVQSRPPMAKFTVGAYFIRMGTWVNRHRFACFGFLYSICMDFGFLF